MPTPLNAVVDLSHHNGNVDLRQAAGDGIIGVIHKATQGTSGLDPMYVTNRGKAQAAGIGHGDRDKFNGTEDQLRKLWLTT